MNIWVIFRLSLMLIGIGFLYRRLVCGMQMRDCSNCVYKKKEKLNDNVCSGNCS